MTKCQSFYKVYTSLLHCVKEAQDYIHQTAAAGAINFGYVSEYNDIGGANWNTDTSNNDAEIINFRNTQINDEKQSKGGFRWIMALESSIATGLLIYHTWAISIYWNDA